MEVHDGLHIPLLTASCGLTRLIRLRSCILALVLCSTSLAVGGRPQVKDPNAILHSRRLAAATSAAPIEFSPTWALPSIDPMQV